MKSVQYETFTIKADHLKLLACLCWSWNHGEFGAPTVNPKKPYGNSDVVHDIIDIVGDKPTVCPHCDEILGKLDEQKYINLHEDLETVLSILGENATSGIVVGATYSRHKYGGSWVLINA